MQFDKTFMRNIPLNLRVRKIIIIIITGIKKRKHFKEKINRTF